MTKLNLLYPSYTLSDQNHSNQVEFHQMCSKSMQSLRLRRAYKKLIMHILRVFKKHLLGLRLSIGNRETSLCQQI